MSFMINEEERTPYGTEVLARVSPAGTAGELAAAVENLNRRAGGRAFTWITEGGRPVGVVSATACASGLVLNASPEGVMPPPVPASQFVAGLRAEAKGDDGAQVFVKFDGGRTKTVAAARLERIPDGQEALYIVTLEAGGGARIETSVDAEAEAPSYSGDMPRCLAALARASKRPNIGKEPLYCHIPSASSRYIDDEELAARAGTICVVDSVTKKGQHLELDLMGVSGDEACRMQENPGDQAAETVAGKCAKYGDRLALFFMYRGKPYAATEFCAKDGMPPTLTLEPWADVDEDGSGEICELAAKSMANGLI